MAKLIRMAKDFWIDPESVVCIGPIADENPNKVIMILANGKSFDLDLLPGETVEQGVMRVVQTLNDLR